MTVSLNTYRQISRDITSYDGDVLYALTVAQRLVEEKTYRLFDLGEHTEKLTANAFGNVQPSATPVVSVSVPAGVTSDGITIQVGGWGYDASLINYNYNSYQDTTPVEVTYIGGYAEGEVPTEIVKAIIELAQVSLHPVFLENIPPGTAAIKVGDLSISSSSPGHTGGSFSGISYIPLGVSRTLRIWRRRDV